MLANFEVLGFQCGSSHFSDETGGVLNRPFAAFETLLRRDRREEVHGAGDDPGPAGLVARADAGAVVAVEVFEELDAIAPVRVFLELLRAAVHRPAAVLVAAGTCWRDGA